MATPADQRGALYADRKPAAPVSASEARKNWNAMMSKERAVAAAKEDALREAATPKSSGLLDDSELVQDYKARRLKRNIPLTKVKQAFAVRSMNRDMRKMQKQQVKELQAFDKDAAKSRALQEADDNAMVKSAGRQEKLEDKQFQKRLEAEAKLKAKQNRQKEKFTAKENRRFKRRRALGRTAAHINLRLGR
jgi:hypothetical protein